MEELLRQIISRLDRMEEGQQQLKAEVAAIRGEFKEEVAAVRGELKEGLAAVRDESKEEARSLRGELKKDIADLRKQFKEETDYIKRQLDENTQMIQDLRHNTEMLNAKVDGLIVNTASKEAIADLDAKFDVLNARLFKQEADLQRLKKVQ